MNLDFKNLGQIPAASTVFQLSIAENGIVWAATPAGLFRGAATDWTPVAGNFPFTQVSAVLSLGKIVLAAGISGGLVYSLHEGKTWQGCSLEQTTQPVICLAASPNYFSDQVLLAGTAGDGILRSVNGGQSWQLVNFGLRDFSIYCLCPSNKWERKEIVFAGTANGVYYSPNGGRAWRFAGLDGITVLCLALHPDFSHVPAILAGTEDQGAWRSVDGGENWAQIELQSSESLTINALLASQDVWLLAASETGIFLSYDEGLSWKPAETQLPGVLSFSEHAGILYAATYQDGIYFSQDRGVSWCKNKDWVAQRFNQLLAWQSAQSKNWVAMGPESGVWLSNNQAQYWQPAPLVDQSKSWFSMAVCQGSLFLADGAGVWCLPAPGEPMDLRFSCESAVISLAALDQLLFAGAFSGELWHSADCGLTWKSIGKPGGWPVVSLAVLKQESGFMLAAALLNQSQNQVEIWRLFASEQGELSSPWELWLSEKTIHQSAVILLAGECGEESWLGIGNALLYRQAGAWHRKHLSAKNAPVSALVKLPQPDRWLASAGVSVFSGGRDGDWTKTDDVNKAFVDFIWGDGGAGKGNLLGLTTSGEVISFEAK